MKIIKFEIEKKKFKKLLKAQVNTISYNGILTGIKFELKGNILTMVSTNGCRLLETTIQVYNPKGKGGGVYSGAMLGRIQFLKAFGKSSAYLDILEITLGNEFMTIKDVANGILYSIPMVEGTFPEYKKLMPKIAEEYTTIGVNVDYLAQLKDLTINERTKLVKLSFKNNSPTSALCINAEAESTQSRMIVMPIKIGDK